MHMTQSQIIRPCALSMPKRVCACACTPLGHTHFRRKYWSGHGLTGLSGCYAPVTRCTQIMLPDPFSRAFRRLGHETSIMHWVGTVDRRGYVSQQKGTICDARGPCPSIWRKFLLSRIRLIRCAYELLRCLYLEIWRFLYSRWRHNRLLYPLRMRAG